MSWRGGIGSVPLLSWLLLAAATAGAEGEATRFSFHPSIEVTTVFEDRPELTGPAGPDVGFWIYPRAEVGYEGPGFELGADLGVDVRRYTGTSSLEDQFGRLSAFGEADLLPGLSLRVENAWEPHYQALGLPEDHGANLVQANRAEGRLRYWRPLPANQEIQIGASGRYFVTEPFAATFMGMVDPSSRADFWQTGGYARWTWGAGRRTALSAEAKVGYRDYAETQRADHLNAALLLGLEARPTSTLEVELEAGYGAILFEGMTNRHQPLGRLELRQALPAGFSVHALGANRFRTNLAGNEVFEAAGEVGVEKQFGEALDASLDLFIAHFEDLGTPSNLYGGVELEGGWTLASQTRLSLAYRYWRNAGDLSGDDFGQNAVFLRFAFRR